MLTTTIVPTGGPRRLAGYDVAAQPLAARASAAWSSRRPWSTAALSGRANLELHASLWGVDPQRPAGAIAELGAALGLDEPARPARRQLQRRPAAAARDRPRAASRPAGAVPRRADRRPRPPHPARAARRDRRRCARREGLTIVLTTHYLEEAERLCDRVAIMHAGSIVALDTPAALLAGLGDELSSCASTATPPPRSRRSTRAASRRRDAYVVGATAHRPAARRGGGEAIAAIDARGLSPPARSPAAAHPRRRLPASHRRRLAGRRLTTRKDARANMAATVARSVPPRAPTPVATRPAHARRAPRGAHRAQPAADRRARC